MVAQAQTAPLVAMTAIHIALILNAQALQAVRAQRKVVGYVTTVNAITVLWMAVPKGLLARQLMVILLRNGDGIVTILLKGLAVHPAACARKPRILVIYLGEEASVLAVQLPLI